MRCTKLFHTNVTAHFCLVVATTSVLISTIVDLDVAEGQKSARARFLIPYAYESQYIEIWIACDMH